MTIEHNALGLSLLAKMMLNSLQTQIINAFNYVTESGLQSYRAVVAIRLVEPCPPRRQLNRSSESRQFSFYGSDWACAPNIRGGPP